MTPLARASGAVSLLLAAVGAAVPGALELQQQDHAFINNTSGNAQLETIAEFPNRQVTGVTVSRDGRVFVCFPLWMPEQYEGAVAEVMDDGSVKPYPDEQWNSWRPGGDADPRNHFVCVQSVVADGEGNLWVLDPGAPQMQGPVENAPKLVRINLASNTVGKVYPFDRSIAPQGSYLNDVRIDHRHGHAYMTESGTGALVVLDLQSGRAHRVLEGHASTRADADIVPMIGGRPLRDEQGKVPAIHADGIALDRSAEHLYYHALTGDRTYRIPTAALREQYDQPESLASAVEDLGRDVLTDGMLLDRDGNLCYSALEYDGILRRTAKGHVQPVIIDRRLRWPDTFAMGPDGRLYVTVSQIHLMPRFNGGTAAFKGPFAVYALQLGEPD